MCAWGRPFLVNAITDKLEYCRNMAEESSIALPPGVKLGKYRILRMIGQGGFGFTYLAVDTSTETECVIKEHFPSFCCWRNPASRSVTATSANDPLQEYPKLLSRFVEEARLLAQLSHQNIVRVLEAFEALGTAYYVMPYVGGRDLLKMARDGKVPETTLLPILRSILGALEYLHRNNIYHRDVKPANILLTADNIPVLIDFGTARAIVSERSATMVASPGYSPLEQITARGKRGPWTDVFSLGATCYQLITGECPPEAADRIVEDADPYCPLATRPELVAQYHPSLLSSIDKALSLRTSDRWQTAREWLAVLPEAPSVSYETQQLPLEQPSATPPKPRRSRRRWGVLMLGLLLALGIPGGGYWLYLHIQELARQEMLAEQARQEKERKEAEIQKNRQKLKERGIDESQYGEKVLSAYDDPELLSLLIAVGADVNQADSDGWTALYWAVGNRNPQCMNLLLGAPGIDVNKAANNGETPLYRAVESEKPNAVKALLEVSGIDVNKADSEGRTPLWRAAESGNVQCVKLLLGAEGIDLNRKDNDGRTPLYQAFDNAYHNECAMLLLQTPGVTSTAEERSTFLRWSVDRNHANSVKYLLATPDIDVNLADSDGRTALYCAVDNSNPQCMNLLLEAPDIDVNKAANNGETPLYRAVESEKPNAVKALLEVSGIDVNKADSEGRTPLWRAAESGNVQCVKLLLAARGIDVNKADSDGRTPLQKAENRGAEDCASLLRAAGAR